MLLIQRNSILKSTIVMVTISLLGLSLHSQEAHRPKIGLVLSGGGAKGFAYIGALKVIEETGIKIDYIGGTSMGAVIGGLYASGYTATQLDSLFNYADMDYLISDYIPRYNKSFLEKKNDEFYAAVVPFQDFKLTAPPAFSKGTYLLNNLTYMLRSVRNVKDFTKLPTPFFCVATNIEDGKQVVIDKGNLALSMLASSAIPTLYSPVEIDGKLLVDGGIVNNYPIDEMRARGADIIIGIDVQEGFAKGKELIDATKLMLQAANLHSKLKIEDNASKTDIYIYPKVESYSIIDFSKGKEIIVKGKEAAMAVMDKLKPLAEPTPYKKPNLKVSNDSLPVKNILSSPLDNYTHKYIIGKLGIKPNTTITYKRLSDGINNLVGTGNFSTVNYSLFENENGNDLDIFLEENPTKMFLKFGIHYDGLTKSAVLANITKKRTLFKNDIASLDIILGDNFRYNFNYFIDVGFNLGLGLKSQLFRFNKNMSADINSAEPSTEELDLITVNYLDLTNKMYLQTELANRFLMSVGTEIKYLKIDDAQSKSIGNITYFNMYGNLFLDMMDKKYFPETGWLFDGSARLYAFSSNNTTTFAPFSTFKAKVDGAIPLWKKKITLLLDEEIGFMLGSNNTNFQDFFLGGYGYETSNTNFSYLYGYDYLSIAGDVYGKTAATADYKMLKKHHLNIAANFLAIQNNTDIKTFDLIKFSYYGGYAVGYGLETPIGPIELKYSWSEHNPKGFAWFTVGFTF